MGIKGWVRFALKRDFLLTEREKARKGYVKKKNQRIFFRKHKEEFCWKQQLKNVIGGRSIRPKVIRTGKERGGGPAVLHINN